MYWNIDFTPILFLAAVGATLGLWKFVEILIWIFSHVTINLQ